MKKNRYGNIEDLVVALRAVTPAGEWQSTGKFPRVSTGPSMDQVLLGSEGTTILSRSCFVVVSFACLETISVLCKTQ